MFQKCWRNSKNMKQNREHLKVRSRYKRDNKLRNMSHREEQHRKQLGSSSSSRACVMGGQTQSTHTTSTAQDNELHNMYFHQKNSFNAFTVPVTYAHCSLILWATVSKNPNIFSVQRIKYKTGQYTNFKSGI